ncbi:MAG: DUF1566 domain-containing protein [Proteobacteria bacterium]|nr:DUF1566 domain-containing protein [Pseudomonadota bacterium]
MKKICVLSVMFFLLTSSSFAGTVDVPRTGQTKCYDSSYPAMEIPCAGTGQDGDIQAGVAWPDPRFTDNTDGTMTDNLTGLMWTKNANLPGGTTDWQQALDYANNLTLADYSDWRLPNVNELESLINANEAHPSTWLNAQGFTNVQVGYYDYYWSSTTGASSSAYALIVIISNGDVSYDSKSSYDYYVWPVRSGQCGSLDQSVICLPKTGQTQCYDTSGGGIPCAGTGQDGEIQAGAARPDPGFTDHGDGTITDNLTGFMWTKNANLPNGSKIWQQALDYVKGMNAGSYSNFGYTDWRLPNRKELHSLTDFSLYSPSLPSGHPFTNVQASYYWSSTTYAGYPHSAWIVGMWGGFVYGGSKPGDVYYVWPVRSPEPTLITLSSFTASPSDRTVILKWTTESEIDNAGFNLYRAESEEGEYVKINTSLILAEGSPTQGATYQFIDEGVKNRTTYYYKLEDIDLNGTSTMHGPVSAEPRKTGFRN